MLTKQTIAKALRAFFVPKRSGLAPTPAQREALQFYVVAAEIRLRCAPGEGDPETAPVGAGLARDAVLCLARALDHARNPEAPLSPNGPTVDALCATLEETGLLPAVDEPSAAVRAALHATDPLAFERMKPDELERLRRALDELAPRLRARVDLRTDAHLRCVGVLRVAVATLVLCYLLTSLAGRVLRGKDIARGKSVTVSSHQPGTPDPSELVDGVVGGSYGAHTLVGGPTPPWIVVDLQRDSHIRKIVVYNRGDLNLDQGLPYTVLVSTDGSKYHVVARRESHFGSGDFLSSPWTIKCNEHARYVRVEASGYIALSELEVYE